jgi:ELWxxDGT repeat protein
VNGIELWRSDGTTASTVLVKDINPGNDSSNAVYLTNVNGTLYFSADNGTSGYELWQAGSTSAVMVKDIQPGTRSSYASALQNVNGTLYFVADDGASGYELWKSNGSAIGTVLAVDITGNSGDSTPSNFRAAGNLLYIAARQENTGQELFALNLATAAQNLKASASAAAVPSTTTLASSPPLSPAASTSQLTPATSASTPSMQSTSHSRPVSVGTHISSLPAVQKTVNTTKLSDENPPVDESLNDFSSLLEADLELHDILFTDVLNLFPLPG